ncbi:hypothetical protein Peur_016257 [Populus x canadensis]
MGCVELGISVAVKFHEEMLSGKGKFGIYCKPNLVCSGTSIIDGLCKDGLVEKAKELFLGMKSSAQQSTETESGRETAVPSIYNSQYHKRQENSRKKTSFSSSLSVSPGLYFFEAKQA